MVSDSRYKSKVRQLIGATKDSPVYQRRAITRNSPLLQSKRLSQFVHASGRPYLHLKNDSALIARSEHSLEEAKSLELDEDILPVSVNEFDGFVRDRVIWDSA